ncbi:putative GTPase-activator protein [Blattamonas nauphoetae]|uniref:GTPase-activator protein n=1 Tax=Blattamonas nauphoetae TaxID=2049346 RepID=A0ABQ9X691_9EUKA|nr:putative GTPase-activator protein [Blattamonas nauphoetae]
MATTFLHLLPHRKDQTALILDLIKLEVQSTIDRTTILRGNSLASKLLSTFLKEIGLPYLRAALTTPILTVINDIKFDLELDAHLIPDQERKESIVARNLSLLTELTSLFLDGLSNPEALSLLPIEIREICSYMKSVSILSTQDSPSSGADLSLVGGIFFLRFVCPSIFGVNSSNILPLYVHADSRAQKNLVLVTKILQNLANSVMFGEKEEKMLPLNVFISKKQKTMNDFLETVSSLNIQDRIQETISTEILPERRPSSTQSSALIPARPHWRFFVKLHEFVQSHDCKMENKKEWNGLLTFITNLAVPPSQWVNVEQTRLSTFVTLYHSSMNTWISPLPSLPAFDIRLCALSMTPKQNKESSLHGLELFSSIDSTPVNSPFLSSMLSSDRTKSFTSTRDVLKLAQIALSPLIIREGGDPNDTHKFLVIGATDATSDGIIFFFPGRIPNDCLSNSKILLLSTLNLLFKLPSTTFSLFIDFSSLPIGYVIDDLNSMSLNQSTEAHSAFSSLYSSVFIVVTTIIRWFHDREEEEKRKEDELLKQATKASIGRKDRPKGFSEIPDELLDKPGSSSRTTTSSRPLRLTQTLMKALREDGFRDGETNHSSSEAPSLDSDPDIRRRRNAVVMFQRNSRGSGRLSRRLSRNLVGLDLHSQSPVPIPPEAPDLSDESSDRENPSFLQFRSRLEIFGSKRLSKQISLFDRVFINKTHITLPTFKLKSIVFYNHLPSTTTLAIFLASLIPSYFPLNIRLQYLHSKSQLKFTFPPSVITSLLSLDSRHHTSLLPASLLSAASSFHSASPFPKQLALSTISYRVLKLSHRGKWMIRTLLVTSTGLLILEGNNVKRILFWGGLSELRYGRESDTEPGEKNKERVKNSLFLSFNLALTRKGSTNNDKTICVFSFDGRDAAQAFVDEVFDVLTTNEEHRQAETIEGDEKKIGAIVKQIEERKRKEDTPSRSPSPISFSLDSLLTILTRTVRPAKKKRTSNEEWLFVTHSSLLFVCEWQIRRDIPFLSIEDLKLGQISSSSRPDPSIHDRLAPIAPRATPVLPTLTVKVMNKVNAQTYLVGRLEHLVPQQFHAQSRKNGKMLETDLVDRMRQFYELLFKRFNSFYNLSKPSDSADIPDEGENDTNTETKPNESLNKTRILQFKHLFPLSASSFLTTRSTPPSIRDERWLFVSTKTNTTLKGGMVRPNFDMSARRRSNSFSFIPITRPRNQTSFELPKPELPKEDEHFEENGTKQMILQPPPSRFSVSLKNGTLSERVSLVDMSINPSSVSSSVSGSGSTSNFVPISESTISSFSSSSSSLNRGMGFSSTQSSQLSGSLSVQDRVNALNRKEPPRPPAPLS